MFHSNIELREGAIFVADAHYNKAKGEIAFLQFLKKLQSGELHAPQLFLLGDLFDALFGGVPYTAVDNQEVIETIEALSHTIEIIYLEGNHDFRLKKFFSNRIAIFPLSKQPLVVSCQNKSVCLAHGDFDAPLGYRLYSFLIRNPLILFVLNLYDSWTCHSILNFVHEHMSQKEQCREYGWFESFVKKRFLRWSECDLFIDGHFHQNRSFQMDGWRYINLGAFACNQRYFIVEFRNDEIILQERTLHKG